MFMQHPCPNPVCTHVFPHAEVQRSSSLKCPRCGHEFRLAAEAKPAAPPAAPLAKLAQPKPAPVAAPIAAIAPARPANSFAAGTPTAKPAPAQDAGNMDFGGATPFAAQHQANDVLLLVRGRSMSCLPCFPSL